MDGSLSHLTVHSGKIAKATHFAGWYDIYTSADCVLRPGLVSVASTNLVITMPSGMRAKIEEKSGRALSGIQVLGGCIDSDYTGEWKVLITPLMPLIDVGLSDKQAVVYKQLMAYGQYTIPADTAIAQFKLELVPVVKIVLSGGYLLEGNVQRGDGGFGSTELHMAQMAVVQYISALKSKGLMAWSDDKELIHLCKDHNFKFVLRTGETFEGTLAACTQMYGAKLVNDILIN